MTFVPPPLPGEFRTRAVELVRVSGQPIPTVARELGVSESGLRKWIKQAEAEEPHHDDHAGPDPAAGLSSSERAELERLRKDKQRLQVENEILRRATALFARDNIAPKHSDHGSQYTSWRFGTRLADAGLLGSMGSIGDCYDNAMIESFWGTLQLEVLDTRKWNTRADLANAIFEWIECWYNPKRRHSSVGMLSPNAYEHQHTRPHTTD
jgi:transposase-like protein